MFGLPREDKSFVLGVRYVLALQVHCSLQQCVLNGAARIVYRGVIGAPLFAGRNVAGVCMLPTLTILLTLVWET